MINTDAKGEGFYNVADCKDQYVMRKQSAKKVYRVDCWRYDLKRWQLVDADDINRCLYLKAGTLVWAGFTY